MSDLVYEICAAVVAAAVVVGVIVFAGVALQLRRLFGRVETTLAITNQSLPGILLESRQLIAKLDRASDSLVAVSERLARLDRVITSAADVLEGLRGALRQTRNVFMPSVANAAGVLAALREGVQWVRPRRDGGEG
jgi:uncharacterized protein YoxC